MLSSPDSQPPTSSNLENKLGYNLRVCDFTDELAQMKVVTVRSSFNLGTEKLSNCRAMQQSSWLNVTYNR